MKVFEFISVTVVLLFFLSSHLFANSDSKKGDAGETSVISSETQDFSFSIALVNDNYSAKWKDGYTNNYLGADDFLTASYLLRFYWHDWRISLNQNTVTSRLFDFRYDLLDLNVAKSFNLEGLSIRPFLGIIFKGDFGGEDIQNSWHRLRDIKKVDLPYSREKGSAFSAGAFFSAERKNLFLPQDKYGINLEVQLFSDYKASRATPMVNYKTNIWQKRIFGELLIGGRIYLNETDQYSEMVRAGLLTAIGLKFRFTDNFFIDSGISFQPSRNLKEDPKYGNSKFNYLPQFWLAISYNSFWKSIYEYLDF